MGEGLRKRKGEFVKSELKFRKRATWSCVRSGRTQLASPGSTRPEARVPCLPPLLAQDCITGDLCPSHGTKRLQGSGWFSPLPVSGTTGWRLRLRASWLVFVRTSVCLANQREVGCVWGARWRPWLHNQVVGVQTWSRKLRTAGCTGRGRGPTSSFWENSSGSPAHKIKKKSWACRGRVGVPLPAVHRNAQTWLSVRGFAKCHVGPLAQPQASAIKTLIFHLKKMESGQVEGLPKATHTPKLEGTLTSHLPDPGAMNDHRPILQLPRLCAGSGVQLTEASGLWRGE